MASGSVLVVDDNPTVLEVAALMIEELGYRVITASGGPEALETLAANPDTFLLVTDVVMPEMTGWILAHIATARHPSLRIIYMTGYSDSVAKPAELLGPLLRKPWRQADFRAAAESLPRLMRARP